MKHIDLSPSALGLFKNCPQRPNGIFEQLGGGEK